MTLCNMSAELGAQTALIAPDETTSCWLEQAGVDNSTFEIERWQTDANALVERTLFSANRLSPQVAAPHSPANAGDVALFKSTPIHLAYIGACTGAKLDDLRAAAQVLNGQRLAPQVQLMIAPASQHDLQLARNEGVLGVLENVGAQLLPTACGACAGYGGTVPENSTVISSTARNFKGRMGPASASVFLASPATVAASAVKGFIADPREFLQ
jgi:3-isopropylmalate/(R)-2-methylmalate dehydratase large subunit